MPVRIVLASSNPGKLREYRELAAGTGIEIDLLPNFEELPAFEESAPTFAENSAGKALHYSRFTAEMVLADDSGLVVPALGGAPGVHSARYAGPNATDADRVEQVAARNARGKRATSGARDSSASWPLHARAARSRSCPIARKESLPTSRAGRTDSDTIPFFVSRMAAAPMPRRPRRKKICASHRGKAFRKLIEFLVPQN